MSASQIEICNLALLRLGADEIMSLTEKSKEAALCNRFYHRSRKAALRRHPWNFALKTDNLAPFATSDQDFDYAYAVPSDCLRVVRVIIEGQTEGVPYAIRGKRLLTDYENPLVEYVRDVTDPNEFDEQFIDALSHYLASELAIPLTGKPSLQKQQFQMFQLAFSGAATTDASESKVDLNLNQSIVESRV